MPDRERRKLVRTAVQAVRGRIPIAVQVTDNSAARILDNIAMARDDGADIPVIAQPYTMTNCKPETTARNQLSYQSTGAEGRAVHRLATINAQWGAGEKGGMVIIIDKIKLLTRLPGVTLLSYPSPLTSRTSNRYRIPFDVACFQTLVRSTGSWKSTGSIPPMYRAYV